jgi:hypothetical protein
MVKFLPKLRRLRNPSRSSLRYHVRRRTRQLSRSCLRNLPGFRPGLDDLAQSLTAFGRAIRAHRRLARLAPEIFDATEVDRLAHRRKQEAEWKAIWEPALISVYGPSPPKDKLRELLESLPQLPRHARTRRVIEREYINLHFWMESGRLAMERHRQRRPHALPTIPQIARLIDIGVTFGRLACGSFNAKSEPLAHAQTLADLERIYGDVAKDKTE